jgi:O-antigen/teichoic acid export membrane protein
VRASLAPSRDAEAHLTRTAGRGVLYITLAKIFFIGAGYAIHFSLPRLLGSKELYGLYGVVASLVNLLNMVILQGVLQSVSKLVSEDERRAGSVRRAALKMQLWVGGGLCLAFFAVAGFIAEYQGDPALAPIYRISTAVVLFYGFYAVFIGILNGRKEFRQQALFDMSYAALKMALVIGAAALGFSITGVFAGWAVAAVLIFVAGAAIVERQGGPALPGIERRLLTFMVPVMLYTLVLNLLLTTDLWILQALVQDAAASGDYTAAQVIARIPYQATLAVTFVVFPLISRATFDGDREAAQSYIRVTLRYSLIVLAAMVSVIAGAAEEVVVVPYPQAYRTAGAALTWLSPAMLLFAVFAIVGSIITGSGRATLALGLGVATIGADVVLCYLLIPEFGPVGAAAASAGSIFLGVLAGLHVIWRTFGAGLPLRTLGRVALATGTVVGLAQAVPASSAYFTVAKCLVLVGLYFGVLLVTGELGRADGERLRQVFARRSREKEVP